ncbi:hypothetical protein E4U14_003908 [Claviceps sp. LM454 group G7]|nr:hypothetical protein E4U14_003908 [Claviceps sp. LM454 group G7]
MLKGSNLPKNLWSESTQAAAFLYNISPSQRLNWQSPVQVLESWFRDHAHLPIRSPDANLKPDWSGVYAYGCRAYPVSRDREADRNRRGDTIGQSREKQRNVRLSSKKAQIV